MSRQHLRVIYLLSLWRASTESGPTWRAWLEDPSRGEGRGFATMDELCSYLKRRVRRLEYELAAGPEPIPVAGESERTGTGNEPPKVAKSTELGLGRDEMEPLKKSSISRDHRKERDAS
jgi:hypothetical protein